MIPRRGKKTLHQRLADLWREKYMDAPYKLGGQSKEEGFDCLSLILYMLWDIGADIPPFWSPQPRYACEYPVRRAGDIDITNYWQDYDLELLPEWFRTLGEEININFRTAGDLLLCRLKNGQWMISMYLGNEHCTIVSGEIDRVAVCPFSLLKPWVIEVRRCLNR